MKASDIDYLFYAMTRAARHSANPDDRDFARQMAEAARDRWFQPTTRQIARMAAVEARLYRKGAAT